MVYKIGIIFETRSVIEKQQMTEIGIEDTLLEYHKVTGKGQNYTIKFVDKLPEDANQIQSVCINSKYIQFYERVDLEKLSNTIFWALE
ncbi:hypothetical protein [Aquimarina longa]|uniref:hypothetical protein n=1 Tax=Aquimarina longa TaxID=1080221 RepID=UPI000780EB3E|nr:hypothetical protein [Aquimarina longa]